MKKKKLILLFLLIGLIGVSGFGVYSYLWSQKSFGGSDYIAVKIFNPEVGLINNESTFVGEGGTIPLICALDENHNSNVTFDENGMFSTGEAYLVCTSTTIITNSGNTDVLVEVSNPVGSSSLEEHVTTTFSDLVTSWTSKVLTPGESATLTASMNVHAVSHYEDNEEHSVTAPVGDNTVQDSEHQFSNISASFTLNVTQVNE